MAETVSAKPPFREAFKSRRSLVMADADFEWQEVDAKTKQPYRLGLADGALFAFAGW
jgi:putative SOS response-associated peptidase YedK